MNTAIASALNFFIYDSIKILLLLIVINYIMAIVRHFLPLEKMRGFLSSRKWYGFDYLLASVFGAITPFCSCSSIPLFVGFVSAGIPLGVTFSFLITSPLVNEAALVLFVSLFGWKITLFYTIAGVLLGVVGGVILSKLRMEKYIEPFVFATKTSSDIAIEHKKYNPWQLQSRFWSEAFTITKQIAPYVLAGIAIGALIHGFIPTGFFEKYITKDNFFAVPLATLIAIPMYSNATGVIPVIQALIDKGIPLGTALAFMMAVVGLSLPEALILKKVMKLPLLAAFFGIVAVGIMIIGYLFNAII